MTGKELILQCFEHKPIPHAPWVPYTGIQIGSLKGYDAEELLKSADKLFECLMESNKQYAPDGQPVIFDLQVEAEILGCELKWDAKSPPTVINHPLASKKELPETIPQRTDGRIPLILNVMQRFSSQVSDTTALYGLVCGPFTLASHLRSTNIFLDMYDDTEYVKNLLSYTSKVAKTMSDYYIDAGMDIIGVVDPLVSQISPEMYEQFLLEPFTEIFDYIRQKGRYGSLFVCGDATKNLEVMCQSKPDCISIDENINLPQAKKITDAHNIVISGNLQLTVTMLLGNQKDNQKAALDLMDSVDATNFILAPGCDMPYDVPASNIVGIGQAVHDAEATRKFVSAYHKEVQHIEVELPEYAELDHILIEVFTVDSATCAACGYMRAAADDMLAEYGDSVKIVEYKITKAENIARVEKMGIANLPAMAIQGIVKYISLIPNKRELTSAVKAAMNESGIKTAT